MSLLFNTATSDVVDIAASANYKSLNPRFFWAWIYPTSFIGFRKIHYIGDVNFGYWDVALSTDAVGDFQCGVEASTFYFYATNTAPLTVNAWNFIAIRLDSTRALNDRIDLLVGSLTAGVTEAGYSSTDGAGVPTAETAGATMAIGNFDPTQTPNRAFPGRIAELGYGSGYLTNNQFDMIRMRPIHTMKAATKVFHRCGIVGTGTQPDWSGNGNTGTVTGATVADHVPLGPPFAVRAGWRGAFTAAAAAAVTPIGHGMLLDGIRNRALQRV